MNSGERLQKLLASAGHGSRRQIEQWIREQRLTVAGRIAQLGDRAEPGADIRLDGKILASRPADERAVLIYHKPLGEMTTRKDPAGRPTVSNDCPRPPRVVGWLSAVSM